MCWVFRVHDPMERTDGPLQFSVTTARTGGSWEELGGFQSTTLWDWVAVHPPERRLELVFSRDCAWGDVWDQARSSPETKWSR